MPFVSYDMPSSDCCSANMQIWLQDYSSHQHPSKYWTLSFKVHTCCSGLLCCSCKLCTHSVAVTSSANACLPMHICHSHKRQSYLGGQDAKVSLQLRQIALVQQQKSAWRPKAGLQQMAASSTIWGKNILCSCSREKAR